MPPLSLAYLAAGLLEHGIEVKVLDLLTSKPSAAKVRRELEGYQPHVVGTTAATMTFPAAARLLKVCKQFDPAITTIIGGPHVSYAWEDTFRRAPWIDVVAIGEGDATVVELVSALRSGGDLREVAGIAICQDGRVLRTAARPLVQQLDDLPMPARHLMPLSRYKALGLACSIISSRGCPYRCIFCSAPNMFGRKVRFREPQRVVDEIESIHRDLGFETVNIVDDTFTASRRHTEALCRELIRRRLPIKWNAYSRVDTLTRELLELMREAGCTFLVFGIESGSQKIMDTIKKGITPDKVRTAARLTSEVGIDSFASFILGLPGETADTVQESVQLAREIFEGYGVQYGFHFLAPFPGTEVYEERERFGIRLLTSNWARYNANEPIAETTPPSLDIVKQIKADYDRDIDLAWGKIREWADAGDEASIERLRARDSGEFIWKVLKGDLIERLGRVKENCTPEEAEDGLARRLARRLGTSPDLARDEVGRLVQKGLLKRQASPSGLAWQWA